MWIAIVGSRELGECPCSTQPKHFPPTPKEQEHAKHCPILIEWQRMLDIVTRLSSRDGFEGIVSGDQPRGADGLAKKVCRLLSVPYRGFPPKPGTEPFWMRAHARNQQVVDASDQLVALFAPGPRTLGTSDTLRRAKEKGIPTFVCHAGHWSSD